MYWTDLTSIVPNYVVKYVILNIFFVNHPTLLYTKHESVFTTNHTILIYNCSTFVQSVHNTTDSFLEV